MATNLNVTELDFDQIKDNLKSFLKQQSEFNDYNFEGSGLSTLLDVLAYNTHYNAVAAHYSLNEAFLDSAQIRGNVVTRAKLLGYIPRSVLSPRASITLTVQGGVADPAALILPRGTKFSTTVQGETYNFVTLEETDAVKDIDNRYTFAGVEIAEGVFKTMLYRVDNDIETQKYQIPDADVDTSTLKVTVRENENSQVFQTYSLFESLLNVDQGALVYYLQENTSSKYEIYFGDGIIGNKPTNNNVVTLDYVYTRGEESNGANEFILNGTVGGLVDATYTVNTISPASGGSERETIESIRFNAPLTFTTQNRAVTAEDYRAIILKSFSNISSISSWGGEDNDPVDFGAVYIAIKPITEDKLTDAEKSTIKETILKGKNIVSVRPEIVDPNFTYLELDVFFKYNPNLTDRDSASLRSVVRDTISDYSFNNLNKFDGVFRYSQLLRAIDNSDRSIINSTIRPYMFKLVTVDSARVNNSFVLTYASPLFSQPDSEESTITSSGFNIGGVLHYFGDVAIIDSSNRKVIVYRLEDGQRVTVINNAGLIEPSKGKITLNNFAADVATEVKITVVPNTLDIAPKRDQLLSIDQQYVQIKPEVDTISTSGSAGSIDYTTSTRLR